MVAGRPLLPVAGMAAAVAAAVGVRVMVAGEGEGRASSSLPAAGVFAVVLLCVAVASARLTAARLRAPAFAAVWRGAALGVAGGAVLVAVTALLPGSPLHVWARPSGTDAALWTLLVMCVAGAEELVFRGVLFDAVARIGGAMCAAVVCACAFAVVHVPLYGWRALPLDVGVGLWLGGLRILGGGVAAPAVAHAVADCGAWLVL
jgi:membrane protease YdiL (CAAX protease family)